MHFSVHYTNGGAATAGAVSAWLGTALRGVRARPVRSEGSSQRRAPGRVHGTPGGAGRYRGPVAPRGTGGAGAAMLPALPDGDERELESSEEGGGAGEERRPERHGCTYHGFYGYRR